MSGLEKLTVPLLQGGMGVGLSLSSLAGSVAKCGGMGVISSAHPGFREDDFWQNSAQANSRALKAEIEKAKEISGGKGLIGVNVMSALVQYEQVVKDCVAFGADAIISGAGLPLKLPELVGGSNVLIAPIVSSARACDTILKTWKKRYDRLADFIVIEGAKAGGHLGFKSQELIEGTYKSIAEILAEVKEVVGKYAKIPIYVGGGIFSKQEIKSLIENGAAGVQLSTCFIYTKECDSTDEHKKIMLSAKEEDIKIVHSPVGMPGRALNTPLINTVESGGRVAPTKCIKCIKTCDAATTKYCITSALINAFYGNYEEGLFFCGDKAAKYKEITSVEEVLNALF